MGADGLETFGNKSVVALRGTSQPSGIEPAGGPGERIQEHTPVTEEVGLGLVGIKVEPDDFEQLGHSRVGVARRVAFAAWRHEARVHGWAAAAGRGRESQGNVSRAACRSAAVTLRRSAIAACSMERSKRAFTVRGLPWADWSRRVSAAGSKGLEWMPTS